MKVLFVCLGNICRSPAAEGIFRKKLKIHNLSHLITCDSAGTSAFHAGEPADARMIEHAQMRGYELTSLSRKLIPSDLETFDLILTMDSSNLQNTLALDANGDFAHKVQPMVRYCRIHQIKEVPDPYYRGADGFEYVLDILEDACEELVLALKNQVS